MMCVDGVCGFEFAFRHRKAEICMIGIHAMVTMVNYRMNHDLHFLSKDWQDMKLVTGWGNYESARLAVSGVLEECGVDYGKVTHFWVAGIDEASLYGLDKEKVASVSKHTTDKCDTSYRSELSIPVMKFNAGFDEEEPYFVPYCQIGLPTETEDEMTRICFPQIDVWGEQIRSPHGDHGKAAWNFLHEVLPFFHGP